MSDNNVIIDDDFHSNNSNIDGIEMHFRQMEQTGVMFNYGKLKESIDKYPKWQDFQKRYKETYKPAESI